MNFEDAVVVAFSYLRQAKPGIKVISYDKVKKFRQIIIENISVNRYEYQYNFENPAVYFKGVDVKGETYIILNPTVNFELMEESVFDRMSFCIINASQQANALKVIDLELVNRKFQIIN